jgi:hypothetical protein
MEQKMIKQKMGPRLRSQGLKSWSRDDCSSSCRVQKERKNFANACRRRIPPLVLGICFVGDQTLRLALKLLHRGSSKPTVVGWGSFSIGDLASCGVFVVVVVG